MASTAEPPHRLTEAAISARAHLDGLLAAMDKHGSNGITHPFWLGVMLACTKELVEAYEAAYPDHQTQAKGHRRHLGWEEGRERNMRESIDGTEP
jgi:hypothetical protein